MHIVVLLSIDVQALPPSTNRDCLLSLLATPGVARRAPQRFRAYRASPAEFACCCRALGTNGASLHVLDVTECRLSDLDKCVTLAAALCRTSCLQVLR